MTTRGALSDVLEISKLAGVSQEIDPRHTAAIVFYRFFTLDN